MRGLITVFFSLFLYINNLLASVDLFVYETQPNGGDQTIQGLNQGNQFLASFEYQVEMSQFVEGEVEVVFYNQFGQILHPNTIRHSTSNTAAQEEPIFFNSPTMPMLEGRTQLLAWARRAPNSQITQSFPPDTIVILSLTSVQVSCPGDDDPAEDACQVTFNRPGLAPITLIPPRDGAFVTTGDLPANTTVTSQNNTGPVVVRGQAANPGPWFFGPHVFQGGNDSGEFIFIDSDQGPPASPFIDAFSCQGIPDCVDSPFLRETPRAFLDPETSRFRYKVVFNKRDIFNATNSLGSGVPLTIAYSGFVQNNPALWRDQAGNLGLPGANVKPESNAFVDSFLLPVRFTNSIAPEQDTKTTGTGPYAIAVTGVNPTQPQAVYPDDVINHPYGSPIYPSAAPYPFKYPYPVSLSPGLYQTFSYNFSNLIDGDYEIWVAAEDALAAITQNGQSPGSVNASNQRVAGTTTVISIIKDGVSPNSFSVQLVPTNRYLILGDHADPPLPYNDFQGEIFQIRGTFSDEREDVLTMTFDLTRDDGFLITRPTKNGHYEQVNTIGDFYSSFFDFTNEDPDTSASPPPPHNATGGQRGYQMTIFPIDPQENVSETTQAIYIIKDLVAPQDPVFASPPTSTVVTSTFASILVSSFNLDLPAVPYLDLREHGLVNMNLSIIDSAGRATQFSTAGRSFIISGVASSSKLDDNPSWDKPGGPFGGNGVSGVDFFGEVPERYEFGQRFSLEEFAEGPITLIAQLTDQVGNSSNTTSITIIKNSTGPSVVFNDADRQNSGPDNNYPVPNFAGADDNNYVVSMISPELTVDFGDQLTPGDPDPGTIDELYVEGLAIDAVTTIDRVEVRSAHIPAVNASLQSTGFTVTTFNVNLDITGVIEGIREVVSFQAFDDSNIPGDPSSISVYRDTSPADPPIVLSPSKLPTDSVLRVYSASDIIRLSGRLSAKDSRVLTVSPGELFRSKVIALTPPEDPSAFSTGDQIPRIARSSPQKVPRLDSFNSSLPESDTEAHYDYVELDDSGSWFFDLYIGNVPVSYTSPTTLYLQTVDQFDNTDPDFSVAPVEVFYFPDGGLLQSLSLLEFQGTSQTIKIYPPVSLPPSILETLFVGIENVKFELRTLIPMVQAPNLSLTQFSADTRVASLLSSVDQVKGQTVFQYQYSVLPSVGKYDGRVEARVNKGLDLFGNSIREQSISTAFYVDSLAPNIVTTEPLFIAKEIQPLFDPPQGSRINFQGVTISASFSDFFPSNGSFDRSGVDTATSFLKIFGPLATSPESELSIQATTTITGFDFSFMVMDSMQGGVYRLMLEAADKLNNRYRFYSNIVFDETPIAGPLLVTNPANQSVVSTLPITGTTQFIDLHVEHIDVDSAATNFDLRSPNGQLLPLSSKIILNQSLIRRYLANPVPADGSADGTYKIEITSVDLAGNAMVKVHEFLLDTTAPLTGNFFPDFNTCNAADLNIFDLLVQDAPGRQDIVIPTAGIDAKSSLQLKMLEPSYPRSKRLTDYIFEGESQLLEQVENITQEELKLAFINSSGAQITRLGVGGVDDGNLGLFAEVYDSVGNLRTTSTLFYYDTQAPTIAIEEFSDFRLIGVTSGFDLNIGGFIADDGPCHFNVIGEAHNGITTLELSVFNYDIDLQSVTGVFIPTLAVDGLEATDPISFPYHSAQANWGYSTFVSFQGSLVNQYYKLNLEVSDQAGNAKHISRIFQLIDHNMATPSIVHPPIESELDGQIVTYRTSDEILSLRWQNIVGIELIEIEVYRPRLSSIVPIHKVTYPAVQQISDPLSLNMNLIGSEPSLVKVTDIELFRYRIRGSDNSGRTSLWSQFYDLELDRRLLTVEQILIYQIGGVSDLSASGAFLSTPEFELEVIFNKRFEPNSKGIAELYVIDWDKKISLEPQLKTTFTTDRVYLEGSIPLRPEEDFPRERLKLHISGYRDLVNQSMQVFDQSFAVDFGPDTRIQLFSNPVVDEELISVVRLISHLDQLEPIVVRRLGGEVVSPTISIRKGFESKSLNPLPLNEVISEITGGEVASSFSVPLQVSVSDVGFYFLMINYEDQFGRVISKEKEISLGRFRPSSDFNLSNRSGARLSYGVVDSDDKFSGLISMVEPVGNSAETSGTWRFHTNFDWLANSVSLRGLAMKLRLPSKIESKLTSHTVLIRKTSNSWSYVQKVSLGQSLITTLGEQYSLADDLFTPELKWLEERSLSPGWQVAPFELKDLGSGLNWSSLELSLDGEDLVWSLDGSDLQMKVPQIVGSGKRSLDISVSDYSGRKLHLSRAVQVLAGVGIDWAYVVPNPVRESSMVLHYFLGGPAQSGFVKVYDSSGNRVFQEEVSFSPGKNKWNAELINTDGEELSNGVYFFKLEVRQNSRIFRRKGKFVILR